MSSCSVVLLATLAVLGGCGRHGFEALTTSDSGADDDAGPLPDGTVVDPDAIDITVFERSSNPTLMAIEGATVVVIDPATTQVLTTDADGKVHAIVTGPAAVHVAVHTTAPDHWNITTYEDVPPGRAITVGPLAAPPPFPAMRTLPLAPVTNTTLYGTTFPSPCGTGGGSTGPDLLLSYYGACANTAIPVIARAMNGATLVATQLFTVVPATTSSVTSAWQTPAMRDIGFPTNPSLGYFAAVPYHQQAGFFVGMPAVDMSVAVGSVTTNTAPDSIDAVSINYGTGLHTRELYSEVVPAVGGRITVDGTRDVRTIQTFVRTQAIHELAWTYVAAGQVHRGTVVGVREDYGNTTHTYVVDPERSFVTRPRLPAPLDTLYDGADTNVIDAFLYQLADQTFDQARETAEDLVSSGREPSGLTFWARDAYRVVN